MTARRFTRAAKPWRRVAPIGRVIVKDGTIIGGHDMSGATGSLWRVTTGGQGWVMMDAPLPAGLESFPADDHRHTLLLLEVDDCKPWREEREP